MRVPLIGRFNVYNAMAALAAANSLGVSLREAVVSLAKAPQVPGRLEAVPAKRQFQIFVDYAHTDDAFSMFSRRYASSARDGSSSSLVRAAIATGKSARSWAGWPIKTPTTASSPLTIRGRKTHSASSRT